jgi:hypothetical protein
MKALLALLLASTLTVSAVASDAPKKEEERFKTVCVDIQGKDGKPVIDPKTKKPKQDCKTVKIRKKHEGTKVPEKK